MNIQNVFELYSNLHNDNLSFVYQGNFDDKITDRIIDISESTIASKQEQHKISNKVSFLLAECFQNIIRHGDFHDGLSTIPAGIFVTRYINKSYYISSANLIANKYVEELRSKLELLNQMSPEDLKRLYIEVLTNNQLTNKGGAGLGLIEMARKSGQKLAFEFEEVDENYSYFYLQIKLKSPINDEGVNIDTNVAKDFHRMMAADNIFLIHKGDFSQHTIVPILRMIEDNLNEEHDRLGKSRKKIFHILVEILQNVSKHGLVVKGVREGIFMMGREDNKFVVYTGNYISNDKVKKLIDHIEKLNSMNRDELLDLYKKTLHSGTIFDKGSAGLGLIDVAKESSSKIQHRVKKIDDEKSFFSLGVIV